MNLQNYFPSKASLKWSSIWKKKNRQFLISRCFVGCPNAGISKYKVLNRIVFLSNVLMQEKKNKLCCLSSSFSLREIHNNNKSKERQNNDFSQTVRQTIWKVVFASTKSICVGWTRKHKVRFKSNQFRRTNRWKLKLMQKKMEKNHWNNHVIRHTKIECFHAWNDNFFFRYFYSFVFLCFFRSADCWPRKRLFSVNLPTKIHLKLKICFSRKWTHFGRQLAGILFFFLVYPK